MFYVLGHRAEYVTFAWMVWEVTHDALHLGYLGLAQGVPLVLFQLWGGVLADRVNRLRLLLATQVLTTATLATAFALSALGSIRVEHLYLTQVSTHLQQAVPDHLRGRVMSLYALCWNLLPLGGLLGGVLAAAVDARFAVLMGGAMVAANALVLLASRRLRLL